MVQDGMHGSYLAFPPSGRGLWPLPIASPLSVPCLVDRWDTVAVALGEQLSTPLVTSFGFRRDGSLVHCRMVFSAGRFHPAMRAKSLVVCSGFIVMLMSNSRLRAALAVSSLSCMTEVVLFKSSGIGDDGSDEGDHCVEFDCGPLRGKCPSKRMCTANQTWWPDDNSYHPFEWYLCNGVVDCYDGSDEKKDYCKSFNCSAYKGNATKCPNGVECLWGETYDRSDDPKYKLCDGIPNCKDGSDEAAWYCNNRLCSTPRIGEELSMITFFRCDGGRCLRTEAFCNGTKECRDGSDEQNCQSKPCPEGFRKCKDGRTCRYAFAFCNGIRDCPDGSDESSQTCGCDLKQRLCDDNKTCVPTLKFCDGIQDCPDGSDENRESGCIDLKCNASSGEYYCPTGPLSFSCLSRSDFCNGMPDCPDGSDEKIANCRKLPCDYESDFRCEDGSRCITLLDQCDGEYSCQDKSDEKSSLCKTFDCSSTGKVKCPSGVGCMSRENLCDGKRDCLDGSDETRAACASITRCKSEQVLCKSPRKCRPGVYCDGIYDCRDGADEDPSFCKNYTCGSETWRCKNDIQCIGTPLVCDGKNHCKDGSDEEASFCQSYNCTSPEGTGSSRFKCPTNDKKWSTV
ncbi:hypothetical protein CBR_g37984 [Chara braunii]|uniref:Uncharacterized protein n=1 Tax=Chara braunii TaxID=69332 RepID=A0A388LPC5_CHABU|nr:hypothetical protein CBR_g37984 [Chara braunii]|eukprot:GBG84109.1 hypothetical protein CBR_g37984 [Chara braunii]